MEAELDMNSNRILNLPAPVDPTDPIRLGDVTIDVEAIASQVLPTKADTTGGNVTASVFKPALNIFVKSVEDVFTGVGQGDAATDTAAFQALAALGKPFYAKQDYVLSNRVTLAAGSKVINEKGRLTRIYVKTGTGQFDRSNQAVGTLKDSNACVFLSDGANDTGLVGLKFVMESNAGTRMVRPVVIDLSNDVLLEDLEMTGFKDPLGGLITFDRSDRIVVRNIKGYDCYTDSLTNTGSQLSVVEFDNNAGGDWSQDFLIDGVSGWNVTQSAASAELYGYQTDLVNGQSRGRNGGTIRNLKADGFTEVLDFWGDYTNIDTINATNTINIPLKFIYGASFNNVSNVTSDGTGLGAILLANSINASAIGPCKDNTFTNLKLYNNGSLWASKWNNAGKPKINNSVQPAINLVAEGAVVANWPSGNKFDGVVEGFSAAVCPVGIQNSYAGPDNVFTGRITASTVGKVAANLYNDVANRLIVNLDRATRVTATLSGTPALVDDTIIPFSTELRDDLGEWDNAAYRFYPKVPGRYRFHGQLRCPGISASAITIGVRFRVNSVETVINAQLFSNGGNVYAVFDETLDLNTNSNPADSGSFTNYVALHYFSSPSVSVSPTVDDKLSFLKIDYVR